VGDHEGGGLSEQRGEELRVDVPAADDGDGARAWSELLESGKGQRARALGDDSPVDTIEHAFEILGVDRRGEAVDGVLIESRTVRVVADGQAVKAPSPVVYGRVHSDIRVVGS